MCRPLQIIIDLIDLLQDEVGGPQTVTGFGHT